MGVTDGTVIGATKIVSNGSPSDRWNLVIVSEGYQASELATFATDADNVASTLLSTAPFNDVVGFPFPRSLNRAINVYRVDVSSTDSGADDPATCSGGTGATAATFFDASFCNSGIRRLLLADTASVINVVNTHVPQWHAILLMVNSGIYGGGGGQIGTFSKAPQALEIALHELGHTAFGLADEYEYWAGCGVDTTQNNHPPGEPSQPNVTLDSNRATIKWGSLIAAATPMPTTNNANCAVCDPQSNPLPAGTVGAFEGAHYYHCDAYRPEFHCKMRALNHPFCAVCSNVIRGTLLPYMPPPKRWYEIDWKDLIRGLREIDWVVDPSPLDLARFRGRDVRPASQPPDDLTQILQNIDRLSPVQLQIALLRVRASIARLEATAKVIEGKMGQQL
jgi:hypothetical protein